MSKLAAFTYRNDCFLSVTHCVLDTSKVFSFGLYSYFIVICVWADRCGSVQKKSRDRNVIPLFKKNHERWKTVENLISTYFYATIKWNGGFDFEKNRKSEEYQIRFTVNKADTG